METFEQLVLAAFPGAKTGEYVTQTYLDFLSQEYEADLDKMLFATSVCSDDVNVSTDFRRVLDRPFTMGGLSGLPFTGYTGMAAFAHHVPDNGDAFILYGPHIGITKSGVLGQMRRHGQHHDSHSCGALMLALNRIEKNEAGTPRNYDHQQQMIEKCLIPHRDVIFSSQSPIKKATELLYDFIHLQIMRLAFLARQEFLCNRLFLLGGIIINTPPDAADYVDVRNFEVINIKNLEQNEPVSILETDAFKEL